MSLDFISGNGWLQLLLYFVVLLALVKRLGSYMARVYIGSNHLIDMQSMRHLI